jgi:hypothetical protein
MSIFGRIIGKKDAGENQPPRKAEQAVFDLLEVTGSPETVYRKRQAGCMG